MPEGYTHVRIAKNAAEAAALHINHPEAFACGANGPDIFFFFEVWKTPIRSPGAREPDA